MAGLSGLEKQMRWNSFATVAMDMLNARSEQLFVYTSGEKGFFLSKKVYWEAFIPGEWCTYT